MCVCVSRIEIFSMLVCYHSIDWAVFVCVCMHACVCGLCNTLLTFMTFMFCIDLYKYHQCV